MKREGSDEGWGRRKRFPPPGPSPKELNGITFLRIHVAMANQGDRGCEISRSENVPQGILEEDRLNPLKRRESIAALNRGSLHEEDHEKIRKEDMVREGVTPFEVMVHESWSANWRGEAKIGFWTSQ